MARIVVKPVSEKLKEMKEQVPSGEYCMAKHVYTWMKDVYAGKETSFSEPCRTCRHKGICYQAYLTDWQNLIFPILSREGVSIDMMNCTKPSIKESKQDIEDANLLRQGKFRPTGEYCMSRFFVRWYYAIRRGDQPTKSNACANCPYNAYCVKHHVDFKDHIFPIIERELGNEMA